MSGLLGQIGNDGVHSRVLRTLLYAERRRAVGLPVPTVGFTVIGSADTGSALL
jgi:hypothetical protein